MQFIHDLEEVMVFLHYLDKYFPNFVQTLFQIRSVIDEIAIEFVVTLCACNNADKHNAYQNNEINDILIEFKNNKLIKYRRYIQYNTIYFVRQKIKKSK